MSDRCWCGKGRGCGWQGEWLTLATRMVIFWMSYGKGNIAAIAPVTAGALGFQGVFAALVGRAAGVILGRALRVFRTVQGGAL